MFGFFASLALSEVPKKNKILQLNYKLFRKNVQNRTQDKTWVVLFYDDSDDKQRGVLSDFTRAASLSIDVLNFASVDTKKNVQLTEDCLNSRQNLPKIMIYSYKGAKEYVGNKRPDKMSVNLLKFIPKLTKTADENWKTRIVDQQTIKKAAILFAKNEEAPDFWNALAGVFSKSLLDVGYTNNETLFDAFDVDEIPAIVFINKTGQYNYHGKASFTPLKDAMQSFVAGTYSTKEVESELEQFYFSDELEKECLGHRTICILHASDLLDPTFERLHKEPIGKSVKWFYGADGWPFSFIKKNSIWLINPKTKKATKVPSMSKVEYLINNLNSQDISWTPISDIDNADL